MATKVGTFVKLEIGGVMLVGEQSNSLSSTANMVETSSKVTGRKSAFEYGRLNRSLSAESLSASDAPSTAFAFKTAFEYQESGTKIPFSVAEYDADGEVVAGSIAFSGMALISEVSQENPDDDTLTFSISLQVDEGDVECKVAGAVFFEDLTATGSPTTTAVGIEFGTSVTGLTADAIRVNGATIGALSGSGTTYSLAISAITVDDGGDVEVVIESFNGITAVPSSRKVEILKA